MKKRGKGCQNVLEMSCLSISDDRSFILVIYYINYGFKIKTTENY